MLMIILAFWVPIALLALSLFETKTAVCELGEHGKPCGAGAAFSPSGVSGFVQLQETWFGAVKITYKVVGLRRGEHGFHIHEKADFSDGCKSAGGHFNPFNKEHGSLTDPNRHAGDLGNIVADDEGVAEGTIYSDLLKLEEGTFGIIGRSFMVHADRDDLGRGDNSDPSTKPPINGKCSKVTGNAGARLACGVIKRL